MLLENHDQFHIFPTRVIDFPQITKLEFAHYDWKNEGTISAQDFALSMVAAADMEYLGPLLARVDKLAQESAFDVSRFCFKGKAVLLSATFVQGKNFLFP
jgi:hypothetical protein